MISCKRNLVAGSIKREVHYTMTNGSSCTHKAANPPLSLCRTPPKRQMMGILASAVLRDGGIITRWRNVYTELNVISIKARDS